MERHGFFRTTFEQPGITFLHWLLCEPILRRVLVNVMFARLMEAIYEQTH
jgi:hypothetical protein